MARSLVASLLGMTGLGTASVLGQEAGAAPEGEAVDRLRSDSRAPYVHRITLYDHDGEAISPDDEPAQPYSPYRTCGKCHPVGQIRHGWHFNADLVAGATAADATDASADVAMASGSPGVSPARGRPGEPWIYTDPASGTQLPISGRGWPGTFTPAEVGLSRWDFTLRFGRHFPGGGFGDPPADAPEASLRWSISGDLEIDCMFCHSGDSRHDPAEAARQIEKQNFMWAPTAALGLGVIRGEAEKLPDDWDPFEPPNPDYPEQAAPAVLYDAARFDADDRVFFNITRRPPPERCYFCHSVRPVGPDAPQRWEIAGDVHIAAGMTCTDCHRNGIDHMITRGYDGEAAARGEPGVAAYSCAGCHLGERDREIEGSRDQAGRHAAPCPQHGGIPPLHFEVLTCTACHSGPWPEYEPRRIQTAMAHGLGLPSRERHDDDPPAIYEPIFARSPDGKIAPHRMLWPTYWTTGDGGKPVPVWTIQSAAAKLAKRAKPTEHLGPPTAEDITALSTQLTGLIGDAGKPHYRRGDDREERPCLWPLAHDVRPASQSLGVRGCTDCHRWDSPFFFGNIPAAGADGAARRVAHEFMEVDPQLARSWGSSFLLRSAFFWGASVCMVVVAGVLLRYGLAGLGSLSRRCGGG